jgi:Tol biopolymer transport system component
MIARFACRILIAFAVVLPLVSIGSDARAQLSFRVGPGGQFQPMPIAVADFAGEGDLGQRVSDIITNNLQRSGYFSRSTGRVFRSAPPSTSHRASRHGARPAHRRSSRAACRATDRAG